MLHCSFKVSERDGDEIEEVGLPVLSRTSCPWRLSLTRCLNETSGTLQRGYLLKSKPLKTNVVLLHWMRLNFVLIKSWSHNKIKHIFDNVLKMSYYQFFGGTIFWSQIWLHFIHGKGPFFSWLDFQRWTPLWCPTCFSHAYRELELDFKKPQNRDESAESLITL